MVPDDTGPNLGNRYVELWNVVFQQYNRTADGKLEDLPRKAIDTGAGLERMLAICNGFASMYQTDLFTDLVAVQPAIGRTTLDELEQEARQNIIADHLRSATFLINDGVYPSNTDRGFVLRFLIRRAVRNGKLLGYPEGFFAQLVPAAIQSLEPGYPELRESALRIADAIRHEEQIFDRTLERGVAMLERVIDDALAKRQGVIGGDEAFLLHDTYGFPLELTREIAGERGAAVDTVGFDRLMEEQRGRARRDAAAKRDVVALADLPALRSSFTGYDEGLEIRGEIVAALKNGKPAGSLKSGEDGTLILDRTSFYAERGGQIGDRGTIVSDGARFDVADTQYMGEAIAHSGRVVEGEMSVGDAVIARVAQEWRREIRRHHTSAHLLQRALKDVLGDEVNQAGSWVGIDRMRFDFRWPKRRAHAGAAARGRSSRQRDDPRRRAPRYARAAPRGGEKDGRDLDGRREVRRHDPRRSRPGRRLEFCGGTHSHSTGELGMFVILSESSIGSGIRRIESCVSAAAEDHVAKQSDLIAHAFIDACRGSRRTARPRRADAARRARPADVARAAARAHCLVRSASIYVEQAERKRRPRLRRCDRARGRRRGAAPARQCDSQPAAQRGRRVGGPRQRQRQPARQRERGSDRSTACIPATW